MVYSEKFGCCLERALQKIGDIEGAGHLYNTTKECNVYLNPPLNGTKFLQEVVYFYMHEMENKTVCDDLVTEDHFCGKQTSTWYLVYVSFWTLIFIVGVIGNVLVCFAFLQSAVLRKTVTNYFVTSLAASDLFVVSIIVPLKIHVALHNQEFCAPLVFCQAFYTSDVTFFAASITNLFVISIDRYIAIVRPYDYRDILTPKRAKTLIISIWIYSMLWGVMVHFNPSTMGFDAIYIGYQGCWADNKLFMRISYVMVFYIPCFIMFMIYFKIMRISRTHARHIDARRNSLVGITQKKAKLRSFFPNSNYFLNHKLELRATKVVLVVFGTFLTCWLPLIFINTFHDLVSVGVDSPVARSLVSEVLPISNSLLNPFIYGILHRDFKKSLKRILNTIMLEYQIIGSVLRRSSQSTKSCDMSSQGNQNLDQSGDYEVVKVKQLATDIC